MKLILELDLSHPALETAQGANMAATTLLRGLFENVPKSARFGKSLQNGMESAGKPELTLAEMAEPTADVTTSITAGDSPTIIARLRYSPEDFVSMCTGSASDRRQEFRDQNGDRIEPASTTVAL